MKRFLTLALMVLALGLVYTAATAEDKPADAKPAEGATTIEIVAGGANPIAFDKASFEVPAGKPVKLVLKNNNPAAFIKQAMGHNLVILVAGEVPADFGKKVLEDKDSGATPASDYIPTKDEYVKKMVVHTKLLGPGETDTVEFTAPAAGEYPFMCLFPGHYATMTGKMIVK